MRAVWLILLVIVAISPLAAQEGDSEGDEKIKDTIRKIQEESEKAEEEEDSRRGDGKDDYGCIDAGCEIGCEFFSEFCLDLFGGLLGEYLALVRFAPYPYSNEVPFIFSTVDAAGSGYPKFANLNIATDLSMHFDETYGNTNRLTAQVSAVQLNLFNQTIFSSSEYLSTLSVNVGASLLIRNFDLSSFAGVYVVTNTGTSRFSLGLSSRVFFPAGLYLDVYGLYAFLSKSSGIFHLLVSLNYSIWRFSIGVGYNYNLFVDDVYDGPCMRITFWL
jgi:hypothetical protein